MKCICFLLCICSLLFFSSCGENPLAPPGMISFYSGKIASSGFSVTSESELPFKAAWYGACNEGYVYVEKIEISTTGEEWVEILSGPMEVKVKEGQTVRLGESKHIPSDQYHGLRITFQPKVKFSVINFRNWQVDISSNVDITLEKLPLQMAIGSGGFYTMISPADIVTLTSANNYLIPFDVENGKETFLVFEFRIQWVGDDMDSITDWFFDIGARTTRFLY